MENETPQNDKASFFSDMSWKSALICAVISIVAGGSVGGGVVASKGVRVEGLNQDQADIRYLTKDEAGRKGDARDRQISEINEKLDEKMLSREVYEAYRKGDIERMDRIERMVQQLLEKPSRPNY